jgi:hypothetical protein
MISEMKNKSEKSQNFDIFETWRMKTNINNVLMIKPMSEAMFREKEKILKSLMHTLCMVYPKTRISHYEQLNVLHSRFSQESLIKTYLLKDFVNNLNIFR